MTLPKHLYHYTSQKGLLGILRTNKLWMTNILYLNDSSEFRHMFDLVNSEVSERIKILPSRSTLLTRSGDHEESINDNLHDIYSLIENFCKSINDGRYRMTFQPYIFSLSEKGNDLNQWRSYCPKEGGFSVGFDEKRLLSIIEKYRGYYKFEKCIYSPEEKQNSMKSILDSINTNMESKENLTPEMIFFEIFITAIMTSSSIKHESFEDEQEYRIIQPGNGKDAETRYREGKSMIIPYIEFPSIDEGLLPISKIIVGPTPHPELSKLSVESLLKSEGYKGIDVEKSNIPYRSW